MKQVSIFLISILSALSVQAHQNMSTSDVTITVNGNKNLQVSVDGKTYNLNNSTSIGTRTTIALNDLEVGQHTLQVTRTDLNTGREDRISILFNLRHGYDMLINVNGNSSLELIETKKFVISDNQVSMSDPNFNNLVRSVRNQRAINGRRSIIASAFNNTNNYFTTYQAMRLLQLVNSESYRLQLAKLSYPTITDRGNFNQLHDLLNSQASKNELESYVNNYNVSNSPTNAAMSDANFNSLYQTIQEQWSVSTQMNSLTNSFNNTGNYFSTYQARQLIQLVSAESNRLQLAKLSYRSITDRVNFSQVYSLLNSQVSKNELEAYVNNYNTGSSPTNVAMSEDNFNDLYQTIQLQFFPGEKMNSLTNAFSGSHYFSCAQVKQLIQLVSSESNRLQLAKLSYRTIVDRGNFTQLYDLLNSQASRSELEAYVKTYKDQLS